MPRARGCSVDVASGRILTGNECGHLSQKIDLVALEPSIGTFYLGSHFGGAVDEIRISSVARYTADFTPARRFEPDPATLALYHCDDPDSPTLIDSSGNGRHGIYRGRKQVKASAPR